MDFDLVFSLFVNLYKKIRKIIKKLLTSLDKDDIILNCIIIAYYALFAEKQVFVSINSIIYRRVEATPRIAPEKAVRTV